MEITLPAFHSPLRMLSGLTERGILSSYFLRKRHWVSNTILFYQRPALMSPPPTGTKGMYHFTPTLTAIILIQLSQKASLISGTMGNHSRLMAWMILNIIYSLLLLRHPEYSKDYTRKCGHSLQRFTCPHFSAENSPLLNRHSGKDLFFHQKA